MYFLWVMGETMPSQACHMYSKVLLFQYELLVCCSLLLQKSFKSRKQRRCSDDEDDNDECHVDEKIDSSTDGKISKSRGNFSYNLS